MFSLLGEGSPAFAGAASFFGPEREPTSFLCKGGGPCLAAALLAGERSLGGAGGVGDGFAEVGVEAGLAGGGLGGLGATGLRSACGGGGGTTLREEGIVIC